jgi:transcriptional regulator with XRE-family HTH domain
MIFVAQPITLQAGTERKRKAGPSLEPTAEAVLAKLDETSPLSDQLQALTKDIGLRDRELVKLAGVSRATLARWRKEGDADRPPPLDDLRVIAAILIRTGAMRPRSVAGWLRSRNRGLSMHRPLEVLGDGDFSLVLSAAEAACGARIPVKKIPHAARRDSPSFSTAALDGTSPSSEGEVDS